LKSFQCFILRVTVGSARAAGSAFRKMWLLSRRCCVSKVPSCQFYAFFLRILHLGVVVACLAARWQ